MPANSPNSYKTTKVDSSGKQMPAPKKGAKPKKITTKNPPGGPSTPGALKQRLKDARALRDN